MRQVKFGGEENVNLNFQQEDFMMIKWLMKNIKILIIGCLILVMFIVVLFFKTENSLTSDDVEATQIPVATTDFDENPDLSDEEVLEKYNQALKIFFWFQVGTMSPNIDSSVVIDNQNYYEIVGEVTTYQELVDLMKSVLNDNTVEQLLSTNVYIDYNGKLYGLWGDRGTDQFKGQETYEIVREDNHRIICKVEVEILDNTLKVIDHEIHEFHLKYFPDGKWRFESFYLFR